jgi:hypothetical protein
MNDLDSKYGNSPRCPDHVVIFSSKNICVCFFNVQTSGSHRGDCEEGSLLGLNTVWFNINQLTFAKMHRFNFRG